MYCICLSRHRALTSKCRRGDASPPGEDALLAGEDALPAGKGTLSAGEGTLSTGEDALHAHPYIYHYIYYLEILIDHSALHAPFKEIDMVNCTLE